MIRRPYEPKPSLNTLINKVAAEEMQNPATDDLVVINGWYGERGVAFYPYQSSRDPQAKAGFSVLAPGATTSHTTLGRADAVDLAQFLIDTYDMRLQVRTVTKTVVNVT